MSQGRRYMTPPQIARELGVNTDRVLAMIRRGEMRAIDVREPTSTRPRYRIAPEWLEAWLQARTVPPPEPAPVRRTRRPPTAKQYY